MLLSIRNLRGYRIQARDGFIGKVDQIFFDDQQWVVRYLVVRTGGWLFGRKVLIHPVAVEGVDFGRGAFIVSLTRDQVEKSPDIDTDQPVSRQMEVDYFNYYRWPYYWTGAGIWGTAPYPAQHPEAMGHPYPVTSASIPPGEPQSQAQRGDPNLRSSRAVIGYKVSARDADFGHVKDLFLETGELGDRGDWRIRYILIDTKSWWPSKSALVPVEYVETISWSQSKFMIALEERTIKESPEFRPEKRIRRRAS